MTAHASETSRVIGLARREECPPDAVERVSAALRTPGGEMTLRPMQADALLEVVRQSRVSRRRGAVVRAGTGTGKTLPGLLFATVLPPPDSSWRALYLCPASLRDKTLRELPEYRRHWRISSSLLIHSYEELSRDPDLLRRLRVYLVVCDEAHALKRVSSARTKRVLREARRNPDITWIMMSATSSTRGIGDHGHLFELALREGSPLPRSDQELSSWAACVDAFTTAEASDWGMIRPLVEAYGETGWEEDWQGGESRVRACRRALNARIASTPGVVTGDRVDVESRLILRRVRFDLPPEVEAALSDLDSSGEVPGSGGAAIVGDRDRARSQEQLCAGFYYRWAWERTSAGEPDKRWLQLRRDWSSALAEYLAPGGQGEREGIDTPLQVVQAMGSMPRAVRAAWEGWGPERHRYRVAYVGEGAGGRGEVIPVEPVWVSKAMVDRMAQKLALADKPCIVWYKHKAVARELRARGVRVVLSGEALPWESLTGDGRSVALSEYSHCEGLNLQAWSRMIVTSPGAAKSAPGAQLEQVIGRVHRSGQTADTVVVDVWQHAPPLEANLATALAQARYLQDTSGLPQRLCLGEWMESRQ